MIRRLLNEMGFKSRRQVKSKTKAPSRGRDPQFQTIEETRKDYAQSGNPCLSLDSKRKESLGEIYRPGEVIANQPAEVLDHDLPAYQEGEVTPHGIYDVRENAGHISVTTGSDTGEFACAALRRYWDDVGAARHPDAQRILLLCDCGGSNSYRSHTFKHYLQQWANELKIPIQVAHYPVHCSKYNPVERRLFCHVERSFSGRTFSDKADVAEAAAETKTRTGLTMTVAELPEFEPVRKSGKSISEPDNIDYAEELPEYNYTLHPQQKANL